MIWTGLDLFAKFSDFSCKGSSSSSDEECTGKQEIAGIFGCHGLYFILANFVSHSDIIRQNLSNPQIRQENYSEFTKNIT